MNNLQIANNVLHNIQQYNYEQARENIKLLLKNKAQIGKHWGAITRLTLSIGEISLALRCANNYLALNPDSLNVRLQVAGIYAEANRHKQAIDIVEPFIKANINASSLFHFLGTTYSQLGELDKAKYFLQKSITDTPTLGISWLTLAAIHKFSTEDELFVTLKKLENKITGNNLQTDIPYWFALGKALLDINELEEAFQKFSIGCQKAATFFQYSPAKHKKIVDTIIKKQTVDYFSKLPVFNEHNDKIIFIIGLPRSGTTLLQQILSSHSEINSGGETDCMTIALSKYGEDLSLLTSESKSDELHSKLLHIYHHYKYLLNEKYSTSQFIVDKTLNINHQVGIIRHIFPKASFIKISRSSTATAWSCFRTFFSSGLAWSYNIENIKHFFTNEEKLFSHWKSLFSDDILEITYEDLVTTPHKVIQDCTKHIGINFEENMLQFYKSKSIVKTASVGQVRQPIQSKQFTVSEPISKYFTLL